jgi:hypothetical protein
MFEARRKFRCAIWNGAVLSSVDPICVGDSIANFCAHFDCNVLLQAETAASEEFNRLIRSGQAGPMKLCPQSTLRRSCMKIMWFSVPIMMSGLTEFNGTLGV